MDASNEIPLTDEVSWKKHPQRLEPILHIDKVSGEIIALGIVSIFMIVLLIVSFIPMLLSGNASFIGYGVILAWYGVLGFMAYALWRQSITGLILGRKFTQSQAQTKARILRR